MLAKRGGIFLRPEKGESVFVDVADIPDRMTIALVRRRKVGVNPPWKRANRA